jgi:hypothetical protein
MYSGSSQFLSLSKIFCVIRARLSRGNHDPVFDPPPSRRHARIWNCAGIVPEASPKRTDRGHKQNGETYVVIGFCWFALVPVASGFALRNQRSEVRILSGVLRVTRNGSSKKGYNTPITQQNFEAPKRAPIGCRWEPFHPAVGESFLDWIRYSITDC